jgi:polyisoprenoid-binding protein YceI
MASFAFIKEGNHVLHDKRRQFMNKNIIIPVLLLLTVILSGCFALSEPEAASGTVAAPTLAPAGGEDQAQPAEAEQAQPTAVPEAAADDQAAVEAYPAPEQPTAEPTAVEAYPAGEPVVAPTAATEAYPGSTDASADAASQNADGGASSAFYEIDPARSEARFTINEVLRGTPTTVVGVSQNLGGQISLDLNNPSTAQIGEILINARDLATDNEFRNNAIANEILLTNEHEYITFEPTSISGLPDMAIVGETYPLQITGNLTIIGQTREVTFDAEVTPLSESELEGSASLNILYADFGITIPFARSVESVEDNVLLELDFIAVAN